MVENSVCQGWLDRFGQSRSDPDTTGATGAQDSLLSALLQSGRQLSRPSSSSHPPSPSLQNNTKNCSGFRLVLWCEPGCRHNKTGWCRAARSSPARGTSCTRATSSRGPTAARTAAARWRRTTAGTPRKNSFRSAPILRFAVGCFAEKYSISKFPTYEILLMNLSFHHV